MSSNTTTTTANDNVRESRKRRRPRRRTIDTNKWKKSKTNTLPGCETSNGDSISNNTSPKGGRGRFGVSQVLHNNSEEDDEGKVKRLEERAKMRTEARMKREGESQAIAKEKAETELELKTLMELAEGDHNPAAAKDEICNQVYRWGLVYDILALYLHSEYGYPPPMEYDEEKRQLMEDNPKFSVPFKIESDE